MNQTDYLRDDTLIICPEEVKMAALQYMNAKRILRTVKFMTMDEYRQNYFFTYDSHAVLYLHQKYNYKVQVAKMILSSLYPLKDEHYGKPELDKWVDIKNDLKREGLLKYNPLFHNFLKTIKTVVYGYGKLSEFDRSIINGVVIPFEMKSVPNEVYEFSNMEEEMEYLYNSIADLLNQGVDINDIVIMNMTEENEPFIKRFEHYYNIPIDYRKGDSIIGTSLGREFLRWIEEYDHQEIFEKLQDYQDSPLYGKLVALLNKYIEYNNNADFNLKDVRDLIHEDLLNSKTETPLRNNVVKNIGMFTPLSDNDHVFLLNFNDRFPAMKRDTDLISDALKPLVGLPSSEEENLLIKENVLAYLSGIKNLHLSYSKRSPFTEYRPTTLIDDPVFKKYEPSFKYTEKYNKARLYYGLEEYRKYRNEKDDLKKLYSNYGPGDYLGYDNQFTGLSAEQLGQMKPPVLSYSTMDSFYKCAFRYYLDNKLKPQESDGTFYSRLGTFFHDILQQAFHPGFDFEEAWSSYLAKETVYTSSEEEFFCGKLKEDLKLIIRNISEQKSHSRLTSDLAEQKVLWFDNREAAFTGVIDKVAYYKGPNRTLVAIIDYKTGKTTLDLNLVDYGLSMQLPCYLFLMKHISSSVIGDPSQFEYVGFYLQHLIADPPKADGSTTIREQKKNFMKLDGYSTDDLARYSYFDDTLNEQGSMFVKSVKLTKSGDLDKRSKTINDQTIDTLTALTEQKIREARESIRKGEFFINPKWIGSKNVSCRYCPYTDICYRRNSNFVNPGNQEITEGEGEEEEL
ncbi:MAG: PD-(D/E)XK nuclease family protein [Erysipelotrichaceae bacterium]|nr:PD-(D/E)XK nuclease family protein [Erysipelotrichaceae bacterium]